MDKYILLPYDLSSGHSVYEIGVYTVLCSFADNVTGECYPSYTTIGKILGISRPTVIKAIKSLELSGLIKVVKRVVNNECQSNVYVVSGRSVVKQDEKAETSKTDLPPSKTDLPPSKLDLPPSKPRLHRTNTQLTNTYLTNTKLTNEDTLQSKACNVEKIGTVNTVPTSKIKKESFDYKRIETIYINNYKNLYGKAPILNYPKHRKIIKRLVESGASYDSIESVLEEGTKDKWIVNAGYGFELLLSSSVYNRLLAKAPDKIKTDAVNDVQEKLREARKEAESVSAEEQEYFLNELAKLRKKMTENDKHRERDVLGVANA